MGLFGTKNDVNECGVTIDIGSGSVGIAIVYSENITEKLHVIWSHREYILLKDHADTDEMIRNMSATIMNALLELGSTGAKALYAFNPTLRMKTVQVAICAPWSHTVTKSISYEKEHPFVVDEKLIDDLVGGAQKQFRESSNGEAVIDAQGLEIIHNITVGVELNGYYIRKPFGQTARTVSLAQITEVAEKKLLETLRDALNKILPKASVEICSFMYLYYQTLRELHPDTSEICLIDVTNEATEVGIVRDDILRHVSHIPVGAFTLAREVAKITGMPKEEAFTLLKDGTKGLDAFSDQKRSAIEALFESYQDEVARLFAHTGDTLSIPKTLFLHTSAHTEAFFASQLQKSAKKATNANHTVHHFTSELLGKKELQDTALAVSIHHFHVREMYQTIAL